MDDLFLLSERQMAQISRIFHYRMAWPRVDDRRVVSGVVYVIRKGLQWRTRPRIIGHTRRFTTASSGGAGLASSTASSRLSRATAQSPNAS